MAVGPHLDALLMPNVNMIRQSGGGKAGVKSTASE